jgi:sensor histidine kinase YesM
MRSSHYKWFRLYGYPGFAIILYLITVLINPYERAVQNLRQLSTLDLAFDLLVNVGYAALIFETGIQLTAILNRAMPWEGRVKTRFIIQFLLHVAIIILIVALFFQIDFPARFMYDQLGFRQATIIGVIFSLLITTVFTTEYFFYKWNDSRMEVLESKKNTVQAQLDALKLQLDPHFLFNNLSTLASLIEDNQQLAVDYVLNLSSIYRYMLSNRVQNTIRLSEELEFISAYLFLYHIRYGDLISLEMSDAGEYGQKGIAPLTLQLLVENAIKHNLFSRSAPLIITIFYQNGYIVVHNNKTPKPAGEPTSKLGLKNISERYLLLSHVPPVIHDGGDFFEVKIPLLDYHK